jgi:hypothetical protein
MWIQVRHVRFVALIQQPGSRAAAGVAARGAAVLAVMMMVMRTAGGRQHGAKE